MQSLFSKAVAHALPHSTHQLCLQRIRPCVRASAVVQPRRTLLLGAGSLLLMQKAEEAQADTCATMELDANAKRLKGERDPELEAIAFECRQKDIARQKLEASDYDQASSRKTAGPAPNVPVANLDTEYAQETLQLADEIERYLTMDVYDRDRVLLIKDMKAKSLAWVAKYARGGSARSQSARKMYIATDAVSGFLASAGLAPMPQAKKQATQKSLDDARSFLVKGI